MSCIDYFLEIGRDLSQTIEALLRVHEKIVHPKQEAEGILTLLKLVSAYLGFTTVPASVKQVTKESVQLLQMFAARHYQLF